VRNKKETIWFGETRAARTFVGRQAYLLGRAGGEEIGDGREEVPAGVRLQVGGRREESVPAESKRRGVRCGRENRVTDSDGG
jgi:hypothetical protein